MAVTLPSDLLVDVMRNADPARQKATVDRLKAMNPTGSGAFAGVFDQLANQPVGHSASSLTSSPAGMAHSMGGTIAPNGKTAFKGFEQMVLRNLFETLLPSEESGSFGGGPSAGVWRSMAADQLAGVYANAGGVGIAHMLSARAGDATPRPAAQWPYFTMDGIHAFSG